MKNKDDKTVIGIPINSIISKNITTFKDISSEKISELEDELETLRIKLAACGVAALANTPESIKLHRITSDNPYYSASYRDVCDIVDREMAFRREVEKFKDFFKEHDIIKDLLWDRMDYEGDDGRATLAFKRLKELLDDN